jgi:hypothetical protein
MHICNSQQSILKPKIAKEYVFATLRDGPPGALPLVLREVEVQSVPILQ